MVGGITIVLQSTFPFLVEEEAGEEEDVPGHAAMA